MAELACSEAEGFSLGDVDEDKAHIAAADFLGRVFSWTNRFEMAPQAPVFDAMLAVAHRKLDYSEPAVAAQLDVAARLVTEAATELEADIPEWDTRYVPPSPAPSIEL